MPASPPRPLSNPLKAARAAAATYEACARRLRVFSDPAPAPGPAARRPAGVLARAARPPDPVEESAALRRLAVRCERHLHDELQKVGGSLRVGAVVYQVAGPGKVRAVRD